MDDTGSAKATHIKRLPVTEAGMAGINVERVGRWLASHVDGLAEPVTFELVSGGRSNLTYRLADASGAVYALRRPPLGGVLSTAHDMGREWRFITAAPTSVPVAAPVEYCSDIEVTGTVADLTLLDEVHDVLAPRVPAQRTGIVHGDYRPGNMAFGPDGTVRAIFDWELATSGDPMADLGWLVAGWEDPGDDMPPATSGPGAAPGFGSRAQVIERYARRSGRDVSDLPYWVAFSPWRSASIGVGVGARYLAGHMADDGHAADALSRAAEGVRLAEAAREALLDMGG